MVGMPLNVEAVRNKKKGRRANEKRKQTNHATIVGFVPLIYPRVP